MVLVDLHDRFEFHRLLVRLGAHGRGRQLAFARVDHHMTAAVVVHPMEELVVLLATEVVTDVSEAAELEHLRQAPQASRVARVLVADGRELGEADPDARHPRIAQRLLHLPDGFGAEVRRIREGEQGRVGVVFEMGGDEVQPRFC